MAADEHDCFVRRLEVAPTQVAQVDVFTESLDASLYDRFDGLLIGGSGEFSVLDDVEPIRSLLRFLETTVERGMPTFGSCFGFQAMSLTLGGHVVHDGERAEVGTYELELTNHGNGDHLFGHLPESFLAQQGHKDHVMRLPDGVQNLATSQRSEHQAARFADLIWGTQFHPELTLEDNSRRVLRYQERYAEDMEAVLDTFKPSPATHGLLARFADVLAERK